MMILAPRRNTGGAMVGDIQVGGGAPVVVQSMTNTETSDVIGTADQIIALANAGPALVRIYSSPQSVKSPSITTNPSASV